MLWSIYVIDKIKPIIRLQNITTVKTITDLKKAFKIDSNIIFHPQYIYLYTDYVQAI